jgi:hypothetical protein
VLGANDIPVPYANLGDEELMPRDVLFEGEANHHRRTDRGWTYFIQGAQTMVSGGCWNQASVRRKPH